MIALYSYDFLNFLDKRFIYINVTSNFIGLKNALEDMAFSSSNKLVILSIKPVDIRTNINPYVHPYQELCNRCSYSQINMEISRDSTETDYLYTVAQIACASHRNHFIYSLLHDKAILCGEIINENTFQKMLKFSMRVNSAKEGFHFYDMLKGGKERKNCEWFDKNVINSMMPYQHGSIHENDNVCIQYYLSKKQIYDEDYDLQC